MPFGTYAGCLHFSGIRNWMNPCGKLRSGLGGNTERFVKRVATGTPAESPATQLVDFGTAVTTTGFGNTVVIWSSRIFPHRDPRNVC